MVVDLETCRDRLGTYMELGDAERVVVISRNAPLAFATVPGCIHMGVVTATLGTVVAQLLAMRPPGSGSGYAAIGKPLATACYFFAMQITLLGALVTWRLRKALLRGIKLSGGFGITAVAAGCLIACCRSNAYGYDE
ncbi:hypothetical protein LX36DRAFT_672024 [Colletotrichum falcatum]|nr:hypothetical protein LX36DRAFT_672024 [Colletotrichum falcatum]